MTLIFDTAAPIERYGRKWRMPDHYDIAALQQLVPLGDERERPFITVNGVLMWCQSGAGIVALLERVSDANGDEVKVGCTHAEATQLANDIIARWYGNTLDEGGGAAPDPTEARNTGS